MARYRSFLFPEASITEEVCVLDVRESHHLARGFGARKGATVDLLDGQGRIYHGRLSEANPKAARVAIDSIERFERSPRSVCLLQSMPKGKSMDLILRMATEIGVNSIQPVFTDQGELQIKGDRLASKVEKWRLTMIESCKQCGLPFLPDLLAPISLKDWLSSQEAVSADAIRIVASLEAGSRPLSQTLQDAGALRSVVAAVGPEGDFSEREYAALRAHQFQPVRLGDYVLRAETAAAYLLSVIDSIRTVHVTGSQG